MVIDDELVASRANDVVYKTLQYRKKGKEGQTADCVSCSFTSLMYGMRLRKVGETQMKNIEDLIETLPPLSRSCNSVPVTYDRGYGKMNFLEMIDKKVFFPKQ